MQFAVQSRRHLLLGFLVAAILISIYIFYNAKSDVYNLYETETEINLTDILLNSDCPNKTQIKIEYEIVDRPKLFPCDDLIWEPHYGQRGSYWVLYNYVVGSTHPPCDGSITYTTHSDFTFLDNLEPLVERWRGPVSISVYTPGSDYEETIKRIRYLIDCRSSLIKEFVTFHLFFDENFVPQKIFPPFVKANWPYFNCSEPPSFGDDVNKTFKREKELVYPVNVGRNLARDMAPTFYVLASDIELYPSPNLIPRFLEMLKRNGSYLQRENPRLFVLPIFEVDESVLISEMPKDKGELQRMLKTKKAIPFHKFICEYCHKIPAQDNWIKKEFQVKDELEIFYVGKRQKNFKNWEPIYIGTKLDPGYDERLSWDGLRDKMTQGYVLCVLDYDFMILNNAFLIHRPGIKRPKPKPKGKTEIEKKQNQVIGKSIFPQLKILYGEREGCGI